VGTLRVTGAVGADAATVVGAGAVGTEPAGGGENRGTGGRIGESATGAALEGGGRAGIAAAGAVGPDGGIISGRAGTAAAGAGGVGRWEMGGDTGAAGGGRVAGLPTTGGLTEGNPIMVRLSGGRPAPGAGIEAAGCGVVPVRAMGIAADGRAPGIRDGRDAGGAAGGATGPGVAIGREPDGRVAGLAAHAACAGAVAGGPRSIVISP
jgi:hypothetical protein